MAPHAEGVLCPRHTPLKAGGARRAEIGDRAYAVAGAANPAASASASALSVRSHVKS